MNRLRISIIGPGKVGTALGVLAARAGWVVAAAGGRDAARTQAAARKISPETAAADIARAAAVGELVLLTVSDEAIEGVCRELTAAGALSRAKVVAHCCGALSSDVLAAARDRFGCAIGSMHPLQTFPTVAAAVARLPGAHFVCEGDEPALAAMAQLARDIGSPVVRIAAGPGRKELYHAGAVMACNYLTAIVDAAIELMQAAGVDRAASQAALAALAKATVENAFSMGPPAALTGPIARGDAETVRRHLAAMADLALPGELAQLYRAAGRWTVTLARRKGTIGASAEKALRGLLAEPE